jgi:hypothetical protein
MTKILNFDSFCSINEQQNTSDKNVKVYSLIADGVSRAYGLLGYFINIAQKKIDPSDWEMFSNSIKKQKTYEGKWKQIISISKRLVQALAEYSASENKGKEFKVVGIYDLGDESKPIPAALEKLKSASDILTNNLEDSEKMKLLSLIDKAVSSIKPFQIGVNESISFIGNINEAEGKKAPTPTEVLMLADNLRANVINLKQTINNLSNLFPDSQLSGLKTMQKELDPMLQELERILTKDFEPLKDEKLSSSVRKFYTNKGWDIRTSLEQYMVEASEKLKSFNVELGKKAETVDNFRSGVIREYEPASNIKQFIDTANDILEKIEDSIRKRARIKELEKRSGEVIAGGSEWAKSDKKVDKQIQKADQLQDYFKKKYGERKN